LRAPPAAAISKKGFCALNLLGGGWSDRFTTRERDHRNEITIGFGFRFGFGQLDV
jgi:hypothetical protein